MFLNRVTLIGFVDGPVSVQLAARSAQKIIRFSVATVRQYQVGDECKSACTSHNCLGFGEELASKTIAKGDHVLVEGELAYRSIHRVIQTECGPVELRLQRAQVMVKSIVTLDPEYSDEDANTLVS
jgi:single-stranded DNA-binding protein